MSRIYIILALALVFPAAAGAQEFHPLYPNGNNSAINNGPGNSQNGTSNNNGSVSNGNSNTLTDNFPASTDFTGFVTISLPIASGRTQTRIMSALARSERAELKNYCRSVAPNGDGRLTYVVNGRNRRFKLVAQIENLQLTLSRVSDNEYSGTENVTFRCLID